MSKKKTAPPPSTGILILGMHRSGTSALTRVLNLLGAALGEPLMPAGKDNETGYWEPMPVYEAHEQLLVALSRRWDDIREMPAQWQSHPQAQRCKDVLSAYVSQQLLPHPLWAVKEPRLCRLLPLWQNLLANMPTRVGALIMVRHPLEVAASLSRRDGMPMANGLMLWMQHLIEAEHHTRDMPRVLVHYTDLLTDWRVEVERIAQALGFDWPMAQAQAAPQIEQFLLPQLRHQHAPPDDDALPALARRMVDLTIGIRRGEADWPDMAALAHEVAHASQMFDPCLDALMVGRQWAEQRAHDAETVIARALVRPDELARNAMLLREARDGSLQVVAKLEQTAPLVAELATQIEAQREALAQARDGSIQSLAKLEQTGPLMLELAAQVRAQNDVVSQARDSSVQAQAKLEQTGPLLLELAAQVRTQRDEVGQAREMSMATAAKLEQAVPLLAELTSQIEAQRVQLDDTRMHSAQILAESERWREVSQQNLRALSAEAEERREALQQHLLTVSMEAEERRHEIERLQGEVGRTIAHMEQAHALLHARETELARVNRVLDEHAAYLRQVLSSTSWRLTAPIRGLGETLRGLRQAIGRICRWCYRAIPLSWPMRLRLKSAVFRVLAPLLRRTDAYRRWDAQRHGRWFVPAPPAAAPDLALPVAPSPLGPSESVEASENPVFVPCADDAVAAAQLRARLIAFYLPQFHPIPENDAWWGRGFTEWTNVGKANPQFKGHLQPRLPGELGYYDLRVPDVMRRQIELARQYGVQGFCFHYYWFGGRRLLERPLNQFLADPSLDFPFCVCWANENWTRRWDGLDQEVLIGQEHTPDNDQHFIEDLEPLLRDSRYIRVDGRPLLVVYRPSLLPDCKATLERWRAHCRSVGIGDVFLVMAQFDAEDPRALGFDAAVEFPPHKLARDLPNINHTLAELAPGYQGYVVDYRDIVARARDWPVPPYELIRSVFPSWDNEARKPGRGYTFAHATPARYRGWLEQSIAYANAHPVGGDALVFVNAWNEWAEGAYLEPDRHYGYAWLQATRDALTGAVTADGGAAPVRRVAVVSHDAHPHGAQYLALNLVRGLLALGCEVEVVLLGGGVLQREFEALAPVHEVSVEPDSGLRVIAALRQRGYDRAIANTAVSGLFAGEMARAGFRVVSLVHELPGVLASFGLGAHVAEIAGHAHRVVFAADAVRAGFESVVPLRPGHAALRAQGLYKRNRQRGAIDSARRRLRTCLGVPQSARVVLGVGYADHRKGIDLFVEIGCRVIARGGDVHFVWIGHFDQTLEAGIHKQVAQSGCAERFHFPGRLDDTDDFYAGADVLALTSREDPFPSVVMESLDVAVPVVAFRDAGGFAELLERAGGVLVPLLDTGAFAEAIAHWLGDEPARCQAGADGQALVDAEFAFRTYVFDLLAMLGYDLPRVSVVVPNYNYAKLLPERLRSIFEQTVAPYEVIVLDDASTDDSLDVLRALQKQREFRLVTNARNSGSVFRQWQRGVALARGDYIWIAEADDLSEPRFLETVLRGFDDPSVVLSYAESCQIDADGMITARHYRDYVADIGSERWCEAFISDGKDEIGRVLAVKNAIPNVSAVLFQGQALRQVLEAHLDEIASFRIAGDWCAYVYLLERGRLAFDPAPMNLHRRHGASVTLGSDQLPHLREVQRMQALIAERHPIAADVRANAAAYIEHLRRHFGLIDA
jgi:glycosyltransferase involved in cell wall biosynthesis